jgi:hypothetical protein
MDTDQDPADATPTPRSAAETQTADPERREIPHDLFCQQCGYNLRALTSDRCPECGHSLETVRAREPQIPWVHRKEIGLFRAYWRTIWMVMFQQRRFGEEMARPVSYPDCQRFRWVTVLHTYIPILLATLATYAVGLEAKPRVSGEDLVYQALFAVWPVPIYHALILLFLAAITGVPSYFFHPRGIPVALQNRAIAMSYYASGPLALTFLPGAAAIVAIVLRGEGYAGMAGILFAFVLPLALLLIWLIDLLHISRRVMPQYRGRTYLILVCVPALWGILALLILVGIPLAVWFVVLLVATTV